MSRICEKMMKLIGKDKEPKGHCEAMTQRDINARAVAKREIDKMLGRRR